MSSCTSGARRTGERGLPGMSISPPSFFTRCPVERRERALGRPRGKISARDGRHHHRRSYELVRGLSLIILDSVKRQ